MIPIDYEKERNCAYSRMKGLVVALMWCALIVGVAILIWCVMMPGQQAEAAELINVERLADAIFRAENSKAHPYGIMAHYKHTTPRQACINTINHALRDWDGTGDFILFLQKRYAPLGAKNDPKGLNKNWAKNVRYFLGRTK